MLAIIVIIAIISRDTSLIMVIFKGSFSCKGLWNHDSQKSNSKAVFKLSKTKWKEEDGWVRRIAKQSGGS